MRALFALPLLGLSLLGACAQQQPQLLLAEPGSAQSSTLDDVPATYTNHLAGVTTNRVIPLYVASGFTTGEQERIQAAIQEWNHALNGSVRFDVASATGDGTQPGAWSIAPGKDTLGTSSTGWGHLPSLTINQRLPSNGGSILVFTDRLGGRDLRGVIVHELGVAVGEANERKLYTASVQDCIDESQIKAVGAVGARPNWCETNAKIAAK
jgi:hypothetical protein